MTGPTRTLLLVALPYAAMALFLAGLVWRYRARQTISSLSSQILESRLLPWGAVPFHLGIALLFAGHLAPLLFPRPWQAFVSNRSALLTVESIGSGAAMLCLIGLLVLFIRRVSSPAVRAGATLVDLAVLAVLFAQAALGLGVATLHRWGAVWSATTVMPYLRSLLALSPDPSLVAGVPPLMTVHLAGAWIILGILPFTRLIHLLSLPLGYLVRPPQKVVWVTRR